MEIQYVPPEFVDDVWPSISPMVERGLQHASGDDTTVEEMRDSIANQDMLLCVALDDGEVLGGMVVQIQECSSSAKFAGKTTLSVLMIAGRDSHRWGWDMQRVLQDYADQVGVDTIEAHCRKGTARRLQDMGWRTKATIMELPR